MTCQCIKHNPWQAGDTSASPKRGHLGQRCRKEGKPLAHTPPEHFSNFDTQRENNVPPKAPLSFPKSPLRAPQVCGGSQPGRLRASAGRNPSGRPRPGQGESKSKRQKGKRQKAEEKGQGRARAACQKLWKALHGMGQNPRAAGGGTPRC